ncbi:Hermansky-Pudlak syndrome 3 protein like [Pseudolycoriella hygida]|uniref:Hermansky-Pudlak syndrome 3 protein like n=1 Tax=Pseudolycoriella hygida TaxID=35572 RepID=A0A9Q0N6P7_9DIPT|nr:Hermansky-Pudlak syndrome 3 protein like [Pseudolycoriella hygida]
MVRVFSAYHYRGQTIHTINDEIIATCILENTDRIAIAKSNSFVVDIVSLKSNDDSNDLNHNDNEKLNVVLSFPTVDQVQQIAYCCNGNYLVTLEKRCSRRQGEKFFCRVYANWSALDASTGKNASIRARIAGKVTPTNSTDCLEVIEVPVRNAPKRIACCQTTGNLAISVNCGIVFYKYFRCMNDSTKHQYIDFKEIPFSIDLDFTPNKLEMVENFVTCSNNRFVILFRINLTNSLQSDDAISASLTSDISNSCPIDLPNKKIVNDVVDFSVCNVEEFEVAITSTHERSEQRKHSIGEYKPVSTCLKCNLVRQLTDNDMLIHSESDYTLKVLLQLKQRDTNDPFKCLVLKPIFLRRAHAHDSFISTEHVWKSNHFHELYGATVLVATSNDGYVYQFSNNDKWLTEESNLIASYPFTSSLIDATMNQNVLHALTDRGMETYTLRIGHKLFSSYFEYNLQSSSSEIEACPRLEDPICLIGLRPFLGVKAMLCNNSHMVLLANHGDESVKKDLDEGCWTIYNMTLPSPEDMYGDFDELAKSYFTESGTTYAHLMGEAHVIMRVAKELSTIRSNSETGTDLVKYESVKCEKMFLESCRKLGDFCVMSENREEYCQAFAYYSMGGLLVTEVYERGLSLSKNCGEKSLTGLVHTIKNMFIKHHQCADELGRLLTNVRPHDVAQKTVTFGEELLDLFLVAAPDELAALCLKSQIFRDYMSEKVCEAINTKQDKTNEDKLCLVLESVRRNNQRDTDITLNMFTEESFYEVLTQYWCVLFDSTHIKKSNKHVLSFSELTESYLLPSNAQQIQQSLVSIFIYLTIDTKAVVIDVMLKLLMDYLASSVGQCGYNTAQLILQVLLESYFYDLYVNRRFNGTYSDQSIVNCESMESTTSISCQKCSQQHTQTHSTSATSENCPMEHFCPETMNTDAMKILIRIYLGKLKKAQFDYGLMKTGSDSMNVKGLFKFLQKNIAKLYEHHQSQCSADVEQEPTVSSTLKRPILFLQYRPNYLNRLNPFTDNRFVYNEMGSYALADGEWSDLHLTVIKFQALLSSGRLTRDILQEIVYFFEANAPLLSMESFITLLLPNSNCIAFFIENCPMHLLEFAKCRLNEETLWTDLLLRILDQKDWLIASNSHKFFEKLLEDILKYIVKTKDLASVLRIIPVKKADIADSDTHTGESVERFEDKIFAEYLKQAIDKDRANRLSDMIKTTGHQLYDTYNRNKQFFN